MNGMEKYLYDLCKSLQREVVSSIDKEVCKEALSALEALMRMICSSPLHKDTAHVFHTCLDNVISGEYPLLLLPHFLERYRLPLLFTVIVML